MKKADIKEVLLEDSGSKGEPANPFTNGSNNITANEIAQMKGLLYQSVGRIGALEDQVNNNRVEYNDDPSIVKYDPQDYLDQDSEEEGAGSTAVLLKLSSTATYSATLLRYVYVATAYTDLNDTTGVSCYAIPCSEEVSGAVNVLPADSQFLGFSTDYVYATDKSTYMFDYPRWLE